MTTNQSLIIHKLPTLFSILNELKSNLNFKIEYLNDEEITNISKKNVVVISGDKKATYKTRLKLRNTQLIFKN